MCYLQYYKRCLFLSSLFAQFKIYLKCASLFSQYHQRCTIRTLSIPQTTQANVVASERTIAVPLLVRNLQANGFMDATNPKTSYTANGNESKATNTSMASSGSSKRDTDSSEHTSEYTSEYTSESGDKHSAAAISEDVTVKRGSCQAATLDWGKDPLPQFSAPLPSVQEEQPSIELSSKEGTKTSSSSSSSHYDVVLGADLAFPSNSGNYDVLADILAEALGATTASAANRRSGGGGDDEVYSDEAETPPRVEGWLAHETRRPEVESILLLCSKKQIVFFSVYACVTTSLVES